MMVLMTKNRMNSKYKKPLLFVLLIVTIVSFPSIAVSTNIISDFNNPKTGSKLNSPDVTIIIDNITGASCYGQSDGVLCFTINEENVKEDKEYKVTLELSDSSEDIILSAVNINTTNCITGLPSTDFKIIVDDLFECSINDNIPGPGNLMISSPSVNVSKVSCYGAEDGKIWFEVIGGNAPYIYEWSNGESTDSIYALPAGTFTVTITDSNGCTFESQEFIITEPDLMYAEIETADNKCNGDKEGAAYVSYIEGGTAPYTYEWSNGESTDSIYELPAGTFTVTITDSNDCTFESQELIISEPDLMYAEIETADIKCNGDKEGAAYVSYIDGGTEPYTYEWSNGESTDSIFALPAGTFTLTITDSNDCSFESQELIISEPAMLYAEIETADIKCNGDNDGSAYVSYIDGGTEPYTYEWSNGESTDSIFALPAGSYNVTIADIQGCTYIINKIEINEPEIIVPNDSIEQIRCFGEANGSITLMPSGGVSSYTYNWSDNTNTSSIENLEIGIYSYTITDQNECTFSDTIAIIQPEELIANATVLSDVSCNADSDGSAKIEPIGGAGIITAVWDNASIDYTITNLVGGIYSVTISDENGCTTEDMVQIIKVDDPVIISFDETQTLQNGQKTNLEYEADQELTTYNWAIINTKNINTISNNFQESGMVSSTINIPINLTSERAVGFLLIEIFPQKNECVGESVMTELNILPGESSLFIPEIITPNQDGANDFWDITFSSNVSASDYSVKIFNRGGNLVHETDSYTQSFTGEGCPDGVYYYVINKKNSDEIHKGAITILRN